MKPRDVLGRARRFYDGREKRSFGRFSVVRPEYELITRPQTGLVREVRHTSHLDVRSREQFHGVSEVHDDTRVRPSPEVSAAVVPDDVGRVLGPRGRHARKIEVRTEVDLEGGSDGIPTNHAKVERVVDVPSGRTKRHDPRRLRSRAVPSQAVRAQKSVRA